MKNKKEYLRLVKKLTPKPNKKVDYTRAFLMGGTIGFLGEGIKIILMTYCDLSKDMVTNYVLLITIFIACLLTGLGFFDNLVSKYKSGIIVPITGFAHSIMASILDYKHDGMITGIGSNYFKLAGSVLAYGIISAFVMALVKVIFNV